MNKPAEFETVERKIRLRGLTVLCEIGIHEFERGRKQRVTVDIELTIDPNRQPAHDDIESVVDYDYLRKAVHALVVEKRYNLQETLCQDILSACFSAEAVIAARVQTCKPDVYDDSEAVCHELFARRTAPGKVAKAR